MSSSSGVSLLGLSRLETRNRAPFSRRLTWLRGSPSGGRSEPAPTGGRGVAPTMRCEAQSPRWKPFSAQTASRLAKSVPPNPLGHLPERCPYRARSKRRATASGHFSGWAGRRRPGMGASDALRSFHSGRLPLAPGTVADGRPWSASRLVAAAYRSTTLPGHLTFSASQPGASCGQRRLTPAGASNAPALFGVALFWSVEFPHLVIMVATGRLITTKVFDAAPEGNAPLDPSGPSRRASCC
jgi:hypothetical protein